MFEGVVESVKYGVLLFARPMEAGELGEEEKLPVIIIEESLLNFVLVVSEAVEVQLRLRVLFFSKLQADAWPDQSFNEFVFQLSSQFLVGVNSALGDGGVISSKA